MNYFSLKASCGLCGKNLDLFSFKSRYMLKDGWLCTNCLKTIGGFKYISDKKIKYISDIKKKPIKLTNTKYFSCVGETANNPNGDNRQDVIKKILKNYKKNNIDKNELFGGYTNKEIKEEYGLDNINEFYDISFPGNYKNSTYKGEPCYIILMEDIDGKEYEVANIAKNDIDKFKSLIENHKLIGITINIIGGKIKFLDYDNYDNEFINTKELNYGIELIITYKLNESELEYKY